MLYVSHKLAIRIHCTRCHIWSFSHWSSLTSKSTKHPRTVNQMSLAYSVSQYMLLNRLYFVSPRYEENQPCELRYSSLQIIGVKWQTVQTTDYDRTDTRNGNCTHLPV